MIPHVFYVLSSVFCDVEQSSCVTPHPTLSLKLVSGLRKYWMHALVLIWIAKNILKHSIVFLALLPMDTLKSYFQNLILFTVPH